MDNRLQKLKWNSLLALAYQLVLIVTGLLVPRFMLRFYGSEVNGLVSSITQYLSFINLCDLGISAVISSALYKPLAEQDQEKISRIFSFAKRFFRIIGCILAVYVAAMLVFYPKMVATSFDASYTVCLILAMSISQFAQYFMGLSYQLLLNADQRSYVQLTVNSSTLVLNTAAGIGLMYAGCSVQLLKLLTSLIYLLRPAAMALYVKKHYRLDGKAPVDGSEVPQKWNGVIQHIAYTVHENTDVLLLTACATLSDVSIYSVYTLVVKSVSKLVGAASTGVQALFGNMIARDETQRLRQTYDYYEWAIHTGCTLLFTVTSVLLVPFVRIYTKGVNDANYEVPVFAAVITVACALSCLRDAMYNVLRAAGHYKQTQTASLLEALLNLSVSLLLVFRFGLVGVAVGTVVSTLFFTVYEAVYLSRRIIRRPLIKWIGLLGADLVTAAVLLVSVNWIRVAALDYWHWFLTAVQTGLICLVETAVLQFIFYRKNMLTLCAAVWNKLTRARNGANRNG